MNIRITETPIEWLNSHEKQRIQLFTGVFVFSKENLMNDFCLQQIPGGVECELTAERAGAVKPDRL